jgi:hypothetical protein
MKPWFACRGADLLSMTAEDVAGRLAAHQMARRLAGEPVQLHAWQRAVTLLQGCVRGAGGESWTIALEYDLLRLEKRIDAVLLTDRAILVLEFKGDVVTNADRAQVEDYAQDLFDFHAASRSHPIQPVLVGGTQTPAFQMPLLLPAVLPVAEATPASLAMLLRALHAALPAPRDALDGDAWCAAPYRPVPSIIEAAATLFARNSVAEIAAARADTTNLTRTTAAIEAALKAARSAGEKLVIFVTGIPGAGKTLCGLNIVFGEQRQQGTAFLTGNAPLVAVLREALACNRAGIDLAQGPSADPARRSLGAKLRQARHETEQGLQNVHKFLADNARLTTPPAERVIIFDEAQRAWDAQQATRDTQRRVSTLRMSEPAHTLEIMGRHEGFAGIVALIGNGQEINTGEAGLREWGEVIASNRGWRAVAPARTLSAADRAQRLADHQPEWLTIDDALDLTVSLRSVRDERAARWVDAVLRDAPEEARALAAAKPLPFLLTRSLDAARAALRRLTPGLRRAGFVRSSGARRLRGEGFDAQLTGTDEPVAWFLERWPDIRASDALEVAATEYACQGLELDTVGVAWDLDFRRMAGRWAARRFAGNGWQQEVKEHDFVRNTYRVLLTRARYETVIWVPRGSDPADPFFDRTRDARDYDAIAGFLLSCGARPLDETSLPAPRDIPAATLL